MGGRAIVLFGHGSRDPLWRLPIEAVAQRVAQGDAALAVRCAYLELDQPDLASAVDELVTAGTTHVTVVPMFLGTGRHAREDLPKLVTDLIRRHPRVGFVLQPPVGEHPLVVDLLAKIASE